jgi:tyrosyl-tRNA synthetase
MSAEEILGRNIENLYPNREVVLEKLKGPKKLSFYLGIDPTGPLHLGHSIVLRKLGQIQKLGHQVILLIGDFTAQIGDPSGKDKTRKPLSHLEVKKSSKDYKKIAAKFLDFSGKNAAKLKYNSSWLKKLQFPDILTLASHITVDQMIKRDMFNERIKAGRPIFIHEFLYPMLQGYDSVAMKVDGEVGANDQTFNMLMGRQLEKQILGKEKMIITTKLLTDASGKKMGKSEGNMVNLTDSPNEMFRKITGWTNEMIVPGFELCTDLSMPEVEKIETQLKGGADPKELLIRLAREIIKIYHGEKAAQQATPLDHFKSEKTSLVDALITSGIVKSKSEFVRLMNADAISKEGGEKIKDKNFKLTESLTLNVGKRRVRLEV